MVEPVDFEEYVSSHAPGVEPGPLRQLMEFPQDDLELLHLDKECITLEPPLPEEEEWVQLLMANTTPHTVTHTSLYGLYTTTHTDWLIYCNGGETQTTDKNKDFLSVTLNEHTY